MQQILILGVAFFLTANLLGQDRDNRPLPKFPSQPYAVLKDSVYGWSYSLDGQWLRRQKTIPVIGVSRNKGFYESEENLLGLDNFSSLRAYRIQYGKDSLLCLVKVYKEGRYRYPARKRGWDEFFSAYYFILPFDQWASMLDKYDDGEVHVLRMEALDGRKLKNVDPDEILAEIKELALLRPDYDRNLAVHLQIVDKPKRVRFQLVSLHDIFPDVEGVRQDFTRNGKTVYGSEVLFDYFYYETDYYQFLPLTKPGLMSTPEQDN
jgi:hypothetical protein